MNYLKRLRAKNWAWLNFKFSVGVLWPLYMIFATPETLISAVDATILTVCMALSLLGNLASIVGYIFSMQPGKIGVIGVSIELSGVILAILGPGAYLLTRLSLLFDPAFGLTTGIFFAYSLCAVYLYRLIVLVPRFRFEAHDPSKED